MAPFSAKPKGRQSLCWAIRLSAESANQKISWKTHAFQHLSPAHTWLCAGRKRQVKLAVASPTNLGGRGRAANQVCNAHQWADLALTFHGDCQHHIGNPIESVVFTPFRGHCMTVPWHDTAGASEWL
jgi:hypothetical protein